MVQELQRLRVKSSFKTSLRSRRLVARKPSNAYLRRETRKQPKPTQRCSVNRRDVIVDGDIRATEPETLEQPPFKAHQLA